MQKLIDKFKKWNEPVIDQDMIKLMEWLEWLYARWWGKVLIFTYLVAFFKILVVALTT